MFRALRKRVEKLGPYQSQFLLAVPAALVEPLKFVAVAVAGRGHWITGTGMILAAYAVSLLFVERLFVMVKPRLMTLAWFAGFWHWLVSLRIVGWLTTIKEAVGRRMIASILGANVVATKEKAVRHFRVAQLFSTQADISYCCYFHRERRFPLMPADRLSPDRQLLLPCLA